MSGLSSDLPVLTQADRAALAGWLGVDGGRLDAVPAEVLAALAARMRAAPGGDGGQATVERLTRVIEELLSESRTDRLVELLSRSALEEVVAAELERARRYGRRLAVVLLDVDHLEAINAEHGHAAGDAVLREVAARMRRVLRSSDRVGRWGGDEFLVLCPEISRPAIHAVAEKLLTAVGRPVTVGPRTVPLSLSVGWVAATPEMTTLDLFQGAEEALARARRDGRNRVSG